MSERNHQELSSIKKKKKKAHLPKFDYDEESPKQESIMSVSEKNCHRTDLFECPNVTNYCQLRKVLHPNIFDRNIMRAFAENFEVQFKLSSSKCKISSLNITTMFGEFMFCNGSTKVHWQPSFRHS